jgi:simple sugar transport system permease protein
VKRWLIIALFVLALSVVLTIQVIAGGITSTDSIGKALASPLLGQVFAINLLIGLAIVLFIGEVGWSGAQRVGLTVGLALLIGFVMTLCISHDALSAYRALLTGPISRVNRWAAWLDDSVTMIFCGLAIALVFRAKLFSLGAEGQIHLGAMAAGLVALFVKGIPPAVHIPLALAVGGLVGGLWGLIPAILRAYLEANELVATLMLNPIAILLYNMLLEPLRPPDAGYTVSAPFPDSAVLPHLVGGMRVSAGLFYAIGAVILTWIVLDRTPLGYAIRMVGANSYFARYGGVNVRHTIVLTMVISGVVAGITGGYLALGINQRLILGISSGLAFEGIVVALLARNRPLAVPAMALLYAYLRVGGPIMQTDSNVSLELVRVVQAIIILLFTAEGLVRFLMARLIRQSR